MQARKWARLALTTMTAAVIAAPAYARPAQDGDRDARYSARGDHDRDDRDHDRDDRDHDRDDRNRDRREAYDHGYRDGLHDGENDARHSRPFTIRVNDHGRHDDEFRRGYEQGYRESYERARIVVIEPGPFPQRGPGVIFDRRLPRGYQEPAFARGYSDGYREGVDDGHDRDRYDPVRHGEYRDGDKGYYRDYGSRDAYKNNYRTGFRQGYENGYRDGANGRR